MDFISAPIFRTTTGHFARKREDTGYGSSSIVSKFPCPLAMMRSALSMARRNSSPTDSRTVPGIHVGIRRRTVPRGDEIRRSDHRQRTGKFRNDGRDLLPCLLPFSGKVSGRDSKDRRRSEIHPDPQHQFLILHLKFKTDQYIFIEINSESIKRMERLWN